jgi:hypothetical protein
MKFLIVFVLGCIFGASAFSQPRVLDTRPRTGPEKTSYVSSHVDKLSMLEASRIKDVEWIKKYQAASEIVTNSLIAPVLDEMLKRSIIECFRNTVFFEFDLKKREDLISASNKLTAMQFKKQQFNSLINENGSDIDAIRMEDLNKLSRLKHAEQIADSYSQETINLVKKILTQEPLSSVFVKEWVLSNLNLFELNCHAPEISLKSPRAELFALIKKTLKI